MSLQYCEIILPSSWRVSYFCVQGKKGDRLGQWQACVAAWWRSLWKIAVLRNYSKHRHRGRGTWLACHSFRLSKPVHSCSPHGAGGSTQLHGANVHPHQRGGRLPVLYRPLPANALELIRTRPNGFPFSRFADWATASAGHGPNRNKQPDALEYLHAATNRMAELAAKLIERSPVAPERLHLGPDDIIGPISVEPII